MPVVFVLVTPSFNYFRYYIYCTLFSIILLLSPMTYFLFLIFNWIVAIGFKTPTHWNLWVRHLVLRFCWNWAIYLAHDWQALLEHFGSALETLIILNSPVIHSMRLSTLIQSYVWHARAGTIYYGVSHTSSLCFSFLASYSVDCLSIYLRSALLLELIYLLWDARYTLRSFNIHSEPW